MSGALFAGVVVVFAIVAVVVMRRTQRGAFVERLPLDEHEQVLLEEEGLKLRHRFRRRSLRGGWRVTHRVRSVLTDRRIVLATGGPEGRHKFVILMIVDYTDRRAAGSRDRVRGVPEEVRPARTATRRTRARRSDVSVDDHHGETRLRIVVPFPEAGEGWGDPPEVELATRQAARYEEAIDRGPAERPQVTN